MIGVVALGLAPVAVVGGVAWWAHARATRLKIVDLTAHAPESKRGKRTRTVDAVVLHQMGFSRGNDLMKYRKVTAHFVIAPDGGVAQLHPISARLSASGAFNGRSVAVEFAGNFRSANGKWWRPEQYGRDMLTQAQIESGRRLLRVLRSQSVWHVFAHRQGGANRENCPGPDIWRAVGLWGIQELDLSDGGVGFHLGAGRPVPSAWRS